MIKSAQLRCTGDGRCIKGHAIQKEHARVVTRDSVSTRYTVFDRIQCKPSSTQRSISTANLRDTSESAKTPIVWGMRDRNGEARVTHSPP